MDARKLEPLPFPGKIVKLNHKNKETVSQLQRRLNELGCGLVEVDGDFGTNTLNGVKLFQSRFSDTEGFPLKVDGEVGSITWAAMFGEQSVTVRVDTAVPLLKAVLDFAATQLHVRESPIGSNRGPEVDKYVRSVGLNPAGGHAWCVCFMYFCFEQAAKKLGRANPMIKTGGVLAHWNKAGEKSIPRITRARAIGNPAMIKPGHIFVMDFGGGLGHSGLVERVTGGKIVTIEGNSNAGGSREGVGVFRRSQRTISSINKGFIDYTNL